MHIEALDTYLVLIVVGPQLFPLSMICSNQCGAENLEFGHRIAVFASLGLLIYKMGILTHQVAECRK